jgi:Asp-tRNA(Asn)/Glu-tRNA(Gln) amidotransferase C subunit
MIKLKDVLNEIISQSELDSIESYLDKLFAAIGIDVEFTRHFLDRVNDVRNRKQIEPEELEDLFAKTYEDYGQEITKLGSNAEAVIVDMESNINVPFVLEYNPSTKKLELISKTVMRKQNFQTSNKKLTV